ncbi:MAG: pseudomurein-binding repeat-containing protein [Methanobacterium sp.]
MNMAQFLELLMTATLQINTGNNNPIPLRTYNNPTNPIDDIKAGNIFTAEYLKIANDLKTYMDSTGKTPDYQYQTSLGTHLGFQNLVYMYSFILYVNKVGNYLPNFVPMKPWSSIASQSAGMISNGPTFTIAQISAAAVTVKNYIESNNKLPADVTINGTTMNMAQFLELLMTATQQINTGNNNLIPLKTFNNPSNPVDDIISGNIQKAEYLKIANDLKAYMDATGKSPDYQYQTTLGTHLGFQNLIWMYCKVLNFYNSTKYLPNFAEMKSWTYFSSPTLTTFTIAQITDAGARVKTYVEANKNLPSYVTISGFNVSMSQFLELLMTATLQINSGNTNPIPLKNYSSPTNPVDDIHSGNIQKAEYLQIANNLKAYMDATGKTPDYQYQTTLGTHLGFQNLVYMYSKVLNFYNSAKYLPNFAEMKLWGVVTGQVKEIPAELQQYLVATANCQVTNAQINALAWSLAQGKNDINAATNIFNWVRDNIAYSFYYNTMYGAVGTLNAGAGNCVDTAHLVVALCRAAGIPARYEHLYAQFSSGNWYGHVIAQVYVNGVWYNADASSNYNTFGSISNWNTGTATYYGTYASLPF